MADYEDLLKRSDMFQGLDEADQVLDGGFGLFLVEVGHPLQVGIHGAGIFGDPQRLDECLWKNAGGCEGAGESISCEKSRPSPGKGASNNEIRGSFGRHFDRFR